MEERGDGLTEGGKERGREGRSRGGKEWERGEMV